MLARRASAASAIGAARAKVASLEQEQASAVQAEEYERADDLASAIAAAKAHGAHCVSAWLSAHAACEISTQREGRRRERRREARGEHAAALARLGAVLRERAAMLREAASAMEREAAERHAASEEEVEEETARIRALTRALGEREKELSDRIASKTQSFVEARDAAALEAEMLEKEVEKLRRQLREKEEAARKALATVEAQNSKVAEVELKFAKQMDRLKLEREDIVRDEKERDALEERVREEHAQAQDRILEAQQGGRAAEEDAKKAECAAEVATADVAADVERSAKNDAAVEASRALRAGKSFDREGKKNGAEWGLRSHRFDRHLTRPSLSPFSLSPSLSSLPLSLSSLSPSLPLSLSFLSPSLPLSRGLGSG